MKNFKSHFKFNKQERSGIFFLLLLIIVLQGAYFFVKVVPFRESPAVRADVPTQSQMDSLKTLQSSSDSVKIVPFNPNFISDYKGYTLGMSVKEIDGLHAFRQANKYVNSAEGFQKVTLVSDSLLQVLSPYFKFPTWTQKAGKQHSMGSNSNSNATYSLTSEGLGTDFLDLNSATAKDLKSINGIGERLSARIIKFRNSLGGFVMDEQIYQVYGLEPAVADKVLKRFRVLKKPEIHKIQINTASAYEISRLVYFTKDLSRKIVAYRDSVGKINSFNELTKIQGFPADKIKIIQVYLSIK